MLPLLRHELPAEHVASLRARLFEHIAAYVLGPKMVLTRLCIAVSDCLSFHALIL